jgi:acetoin utilization deacetylase AcuC-like enzyme/GNAT superfamily N-acetyltransferase
MIRIRVIHGGEAPLARDRIAQAQRILRQNFPGWERDAERMWQWLRDPVKSGWRATLLVAETGQGKVNGFALVLHFSRTSSSFLDYIAVRRGIRGGGLGGALYEAVREYCLGIGSRGLYLEAEPDDPALIDDSKRLEQNRRRLRFYEYYDVRPIENTEYDLPLGEPPTHAYLLFDSLNRDEPLSRNEARRTVRMILEKRFGDLTDETYIRRVLNSFRDDPIRLRPPRYVKRRKPGPPAKGRLERAYAVVVNHKHIIHHVPDRGYEERPARVGALMKAVESTRLFTSVRPKRFAESHIVAVHDRHYVSFLKRLCRKLPPGRPVYADTFPRRQPVRRPRHVEPDLVGYYALDSLTPLDSGAYRAARASVDAALTSAEEILAGMPVAYALCRPPGHHAERGLCGGFCYFNNAAIAAQFLSRHGRVSVLDIDFHHGNGTQDIFYRRRDVLTVSIHGDPETAYPYFTGFAKEMGEGEGHRFNRNFPLPPETEDDAYLRTLDKALRIIRRFRPDYLVLSLGFDIMRGDPTGFFSLTPAGAQAIGRRIAAMRLPVLAIQEGGYNLRNLNRGAVSFFRGFAEQDGQHPKR